MCHYRTFEQLLKEMNALDTVIIVTLKVTGLSDPIKIASQTEPAIDQIDQMVVDLVKKNKISGEIHFEKSLQENQQKMYVYKIGQKKCVVLVEKLAKVKEF